MKLKKTFGVFVSLGFFLFLAVRPNPAQAFTAQVTISEDIFGVHIISAV